MKKSKWMPLAVAGAVGIIGWLMYSAMPKPAWRVELCIEYNGQESCKTASGATREAALRIAAENACALISSGPTGTVNCQNTPPKKLVWLSQGK